MDVATYSGWRDLVNDTSSMSVHGIFFDETPSEYTPASAEYLQKINKAVKTAPGIAAEKFVIHNPGTITDPRLQDDSTDLTVVFENSYDQYKKQESVLSSLPEDRSRYAYLIHSISTISGRNLKRFVQSISKHAEALFLTSLQEDYYEAFGSQWKEVVQAVDDLNGS
ncbi:hypothetical protein LTR05_008470 [Lithohypha guttulata]|uniref:Uncharacterized protein n=1 Tax=Lithohypha guttulata TaxID=1690604 RepID=A0AAN7PSE4_9EURO|nr:hypothetical protein LTR05_008470 [Lithohypha guttulata]